VTRITERWRLRIRCSGPLEELRMNLRPENEAGPARLRSLGDAPLPEAIVDDWRRLCALPQPARQAIWEILAPFLTSGPGADLERRIDSFCELRRVARDDVLHALNACQLLFHEAIARNLTREEFERDLDRLPADGGPLRSTLLGGYEQARDAVRGRILSDSILDHGSVLTGVDWRVDQVLASDRGVQLHAPIALLTLRYRRGRQEERVTLQVDAQRLEELRAACERIRALGA
jgi:COMM domain